MSGQKEDLVVFGGHADDGMIDLFCECEDPYMLLDSRIVMFALKMINRSSSGCLLDELEKRGYDASTVKFTISKKAI